MDCWDRTTLDHLDERLPLSILKARPLLRGFAVEETIGTMSIEPHHQVTHNL